ncbi:MAG: peptidase M23 [Rhodospirillaceae bacterium]|nr:peptidase M23 [Rhodospirillaceae bacterium]
MNRGQTLRFGVVVSLALLLAAMLAGCSRPAPAPVIHKGLSKQSDSASQAPSGVMAVVRKGDTLYRIARRHGVSTRALIDANGLRAPFVLRQEQRLEIPVTRQHLVVKGDTVYGISRLYAVDMASLVRANRLAPPYTIRPGQNLRLPGRAALATAPEVPARRTVQRPVKSRTQSATTSTATPSLKPRAKPPARKPPLAKPPPRKGRFAWPLQGRLISRFGPKPGGLHNDGINIAVRVDSEVRATAAGVVAYAGNELRGFGNLLLIKHSGGWMSAYAHNRVLLVKRGDKVRRGQAVGRAGQSGGLAEPQLHFELRKGSKAVDPLKYLAPQSAGVAPASATKRTSCRRCPPLMPQYWRRTG